MLLHKHRVIGLSTQYKSFRSARKRNGQRDSVRPAYPIAAGAAAAVGQPTEWIISPSKAFIHSSWWSREIAHWCSQPVTWNWISKHISRCTPFRIFLASLQRRNCRGSSCDPQLLHSVCWGFSSLAIVTGWPMWWTLVWWRDLKIHIFIGKAEAEINFYAVTPY